jgi:uncharacterized protein
MNEESATMSAPMYAPPVPVAEQPIDVRSGYMTQVYINLMAGIAAFIGMQFVLFVTGLAEQITLFVVQTNWLLILGGFMLVSWMATHLSARARTPGAAWGSYLLLIGANALLFATPLFIAHRAPELDGVISSAAWLSLAGFGLLSAIAITTSKDFSFLRGILMWGGAVALLLIVGGVLLGASLGTWFAVGMIAFAGAAILYDTQRIYRSFPPGTEVVAAMHLFSSIALLFWYVLQLLMRR